MFSKRNKILIVFVLVLYLGTIIFSAYRKDRSRKADFAVTVTAPTTKAVVAAEETKPPDLDGDGSLSEEKAGRPDRKSGGEEKLYPDKMDVSSISEEILGMLHVTDQELSDRIRVFANGQGFAAMEQVYCQGDAAVDRDNHTVSVTLYFNPEGEDGLTKNNCYFDYIYYQDTDEYRIAVW